MSALLRALSTPLRSLALVASLTTLAVVAAGCPGPEYPKCESDDQCKKNKDGKAISEYCVFGQCQECAKDSQCGAGRACNKGRCELMCTTDGECGDGKICEAAKCMSAQCKSDDACGAGGSCQAGRCSKSGNATPGDGTSSAAGDDNRPCDPRARVNFDFNAADLRADGRDTLDHFASCMKKNAAWKLTIEGHCDERGTNEYNLNLGESRAKSIKKYLTALGVEDKRIKVISYGEEKPVDSSSSEDAWAKNRRGELIAN